MSQDYALLLANTLVIALLLLNTLGLEGIGTRNGNKDGVNVTKWAYHVEGWARGKEMWYFREDAQTQLASYHLSFCLEPALAYKHLPWQPNSAFQHCWVQLLCLLCPRQSISYSLLKNFPGRIQIPQDTLFYNLISFPL